MNASSSSTVPETRTRALHIALAGNPNAGKTTLFNALTGLRHKVGNYPGVTVEKKEGRVALSREQDGVILDLPGTYSLSPSSPDEAITRDVLLGRNSDAPLPDGVIIVVDASNLGLNLYLATQVLGLGLPTVVALNMCDVARAQGKTIDADELSRELGAPVVECVAVKSQGLDELKARVVEVCAHGEPRRLELPLPEDLTRARNEVAALLSDDPDALPDANAVALRVLADDNTQFAARDLSPQVQDYLTQVRPNFTGTKAASAQEAQARHTLSAQIARRVTQQAAVENERSFSDRLDRVLMHPFWGMAVFALVVLLVFQAIYSWATIPMDWIDGSMAALGGAVARAMPDGPLQDLIVQGAIAGVGAVVIFLPQILVLFFFIGILEDTGYMARATFVMDRLMARVGLHGRAFIPLVSSFACAIPGIMATRTIADPRDRLTTILIAPLMACSARLPVYALMIGAFIPDQKIWGPIGLRAATLFGLYALGVIAALIVAWVLKRTFLKGPPPALILELPAYKLPNWRNIVVTMWERGSQFLKRAGTVILSLSIVLWFLLNYPKVNVQTARPDVSTPSSVGAPNVLKTPVIEPSKQQKEDAISSQVRYSFAGRLGHFIEPAIAPLGFNWKIGIGLIGAMSAREVFVSTLGTVYSVADADETSQPLQTSLKQDKWPDGRPVWTTLTAVSLLVYFVLAMQCISTLAIVKRETNGWTVPMLMQIYLTALAWLASFAVFQIGRALGW